ncbi:MAG: hypothetical protein K6F84_07725 [Lachnospiraceae bacterium]|nr:hypothetical protein [Lachnospiraceae bacterium]
MTQLLEIRDRIKDFYARNDAFIVPIAKFVTALIVLLVLNNNMGYMTKINNIAIVLIVSLSCSFLPMGAIVFFGAMFSLLHMYALSLEVLIIGFAIYLCVFLLVGRFHFKDSIVLAVVPVLCAMKLTCVIPIVIGLLATPAACFSAACGVVIHYYIQVVKTNSSVISSMSDEGITEKVKLLLDGLIQNKSMVFMAAAVAIAIVAVYMIKRLSVDYAWTIAMVVGVMVTLIILLVGDIIYDTNVSLFGAVVSAVVAIAVGKVIEFFRFCVDFSRTEKLQFEDDEYYYYVKAIPKMNVPASNKSVKNISRPSQMQMSPTRSMIIDGTEGNLDDTRQF